MAKGTFTQILAQIQTDRTAVPANVQSKKIYFATGDPGASRGDEESNLMRGASRQPTEPDLGFFEVAPSIESKLMATCLQLYAACGSMETTMVGGAKSADLAVTGGVIDSIAQTLTLAKVAHGKSIGSSFELAGLTAPASLNGKIFPCIAITADTIVLRIPMGTSSVFTLGAGTVKEVTAAGVMTHTIKAGGALPYYLLEFGFTDINQFLREMGCKCGTLNFSIGAKGSIGLSTKWMGGKQVIDPNSFETGAPLDNGETVFNNLGIVAGSMKEGGAAIATILSIDGITLDNKLDGDSYYVAGEGYRDDVDEGLYSIKGTVRAAFKDMTIYQKALDSTTSSLDFTIKRGSGAGTAGNEKIQVVISELKYKAKAPAFPGSKSVTGDFEFTGFFKSNADGTALKFIVTNSLLPGAMI